MIFRKYEQITVLEYFKQEESSVFEGGKSGSGKAWEYCNCKLEEMGESISRASIIFYLNRMLDEGVFDFYDRTGKGGHHKLYYSKMNLAQFWRFVMKQAYLKLIEASGDTEFMKKLVDAEGNIDIY